MTQPTAATQTTLESSSPCSSSPYSHTTMIPAQSKPRPSAPVTPRPQTSELPPDQLERREFYNTYNAWTGINIAASLGGFFLLLILLLLYKSKCKRSSKLPLCPSVEDGDVSLAEPWESACLSGSVGDRLSLGSGRQLSNESTPVATTRGSRQSVAVGRVAGSRHSLSGRCACSAPGSVQRLPRRPRLSSGGSGSEIGHQLELRVHHPARRGPPRYAYSFDEKASVPESWWQRVDINVIQPTPSVTPSPSLRCLADGDEEPPPRLVPRLDLPRPRGGSIVSSSDLTDFDSRSIGSDSVFLADDDWSSCSEAAPTPRASHRRSPLSRQASVCLDDESLPPDEPALRTELLFVPGAVPGVIRANRPDGGGTPRPASPQFLTVPTPHGALRSPPAPRRSPHLLCPPSPTYGPVRSMSPPPPLPLSPAGVSNVGGGRRRLPTLGRQVSICRNGSLSSSSSSTCSLTGACYASPVCDGRACFAAGVRGLSLDVCPATVAPPGGRQRSRFAVGAGRSLDLGGASGQRSSSSDSSTNADTLTASEERTMSPLSASRNNSASCDVTFSADDVTPCGYDVSMQPPPYNDTVTLKADGAELNDAPRFQVTLSAPDYDTPDPHAAPVSPAEKSAQLRQLLESPQVCNTLTLDLLVRGSDKESSGAESADTPL